MIPVERLCQIMDVSPRGYRAFRSRPLSQSQRKDMVVLAHIREQFALSLGSYGRPRMTEELKELGLPVGHRRFGRLMRENAIAVKRNRKFKAITDSNHSFIIAPNLLNRDFSAARPNRKWAGDISYVWTQEGWLYLAVILDLHSRRVIGCAVSNRMKRDLAIRTLNMAIALRRPSKGCIHHTDLGSQYCSQDYQKILRHHGFKVSMIGTGNCYDNAAVETFFKTSKVELLWQRPWRTRRDAEIAIFEYINGFYNPRCRHSALGWKSPLAFEAKAAQVSNRSGTKA
jgi:putative transposase